MPDEAQLQTDARSSGMMPVSPAKVSAQALLAEGKPLCDWTNHGTLSAILQREVGSNPVEFVTKRLERGPTTIIEHEGANWCAWLDEDYVLYVREDGLALDLDVSVIGLEPSLVALRWDLKMSDHRIPRHEHKLLKAKGYDLGLKYKLPVPDSTTEKLREFVRAYCDGLILCDHQVQRQSDLGMVFMPLLFGAFEAKAPAEGAEPSLEYLAEQSLRVDLGEKPTMPKGPPPPVKPQYPPPPPPPAGRREPDPEHVKLIEDDIRWNVAPPERLTTYLEEIRLHNVGVDYYAANDVLNWEAAKTAIDKAHAKALADHEKALVQLHRENDHIKAAIARWEDEQAYRAAQLEGFHQGRMADVGTIYEEYSKAAPRSINGLPIFYSFRILSRNDWTRARKAITRELERREGMEV